jgi:hypothetical protein
MGEIDDARQQRDALRQTKGRLTDSGRRASESMLRYLGVNLYRERNRSADQDEQAGRKGPATEPEERGEGDADPRVDD